MRKTIVSRRDFLRRSSLCGAGIGLACAGCQPSSTQDTRPNIILIMADDMGYSDIGCFGSEIETPNIDRLASEGIRFTRFYNAARCCPTRASLLTGLYPHQAGMGGMVNIGGRDDGEPGPYQGYLNDTCVTIAEMLKDAGYTTMMSGKWHVGEARPHWPVDRGFDRSFGLISGASNYFSLSRDKAPGIKRTMFRDGEKWTPPEDGFYMTDAFTDFAVECLDTLGREDKPFFQYIAYTAPHWPLHALPEDIVKFEGDYLAGWDALRRDRYRRQRDAGIVGDECPISPRDNEVPSWDDVPQEKKEQMARKMAVYAAQIYCMDRGIGKVLAKLDEIGKAENTLVLFLSDNGGCHEGGIWGQDFWNNGAQPGGKDSYQSYGRSWANLSNTPFRRYKHWVHEGGISTPLIARWPEVISSRGGLNRDTGHIVDIMATCCDIAGTAYPSQRNGSAITPAEGKSLMPVLKGGSRKGHDVLYWEHEGNRAVRKGKWKLVAIAGGPWELYDIEADRTELHNISDEHPEIVSELTALYETWAAENGVRPL